MPTYKVLIEQVKPTGGVAHRETVKVSADNEAQAIRESDFVRTLRFIGGEYEKRVTVLGSVNAQAVAGQGGLFNG
jgi:hypothetical protein